MDTLTLLVLAEHRPRTAMKVGILTDYYVATHCAACAAKLTTRGWVRARIEYETHCRWCGCEMDDTDELNPV